MLAFEWLAVLRQQFWTSPRFDLIKIHNFLQHSYHVPEMRKSGKRGAQPIPKLKKKLAVDISFVTK